MPCRSRCLIGVTIYLLIIAARCFASSAPGTSAPGPSHTDEKRFDSPVLSSGRSYPPDGLVVMRELRADLTGDGKFERVVLAYRLAHAYLLIYREADGGGTELAYREVYRDYLGFEAENVGLVSAPSSYYKDRREHRERAEGADATTDSRVSGRALTVVASGRGWKASTHGLNVEMVAWSHQRNRFERIFAVGARSAFPLVEAVYLVDVDFEADDEVVVFTSTGHWSDPAAKKLYCVYRWSDEQRAYLPTCRQRPVSIDAVSGWIAP